MSATQDREQQLVRGTITSVLVKGNDSWQIAVRPEGSQYEKKIWTKDAPLINSIQAQGIGQRFDFLCNASYWTNNEGKQIRSLWYEAIGEFGSMDDPAPAPAPTGGLPGMGQSAPLAPQQPLSGTPLPGMAPAAPQAQAVGQALSAPDPDWQAIPPVVKDARIMRQTAMKCAVHMLPYLPKDMQTVSGLEFVSEKFVAYFMAGPSDSDLQQTYSARAQAEREIAGNPGGGSDYHPGYAAHADQAIAARQQADDETPPDWVTNDGPVPENYTADTVTGQTPPDPATGYTGGFPA